MNDWYEVKKIDSKTYVISEPFHWEHTNMYYIIGEKRNILLDTGTGIYPLKDILLNIDNKPIDVVTSHVHWDHIGNHKEFNNIYVHECDSNWLENGIPLPDFVIREEVIKDVYKNMLPKEFNIEKYDTYKSKNYSSVSDGHVFDLGNRKIKVIHTPGHSPGHICLFEEDRGYLFSGDILYKGTIYCHYPSTDPKLLNESIKRISNLKVKKVLPGHNLTPLGIEYISKIVKIFVNINKENKLEHGTGLFTVEDVSVQI